jgi:hypothetical protein
MLNTFNKIILSILISLLFVPSIVTADSIWCNYNKTVNNITTIKLECLPVDDINNVNVCEPCINICVKYRDGQCKVLPGSSTPLPSSKSGDIQFTPQVPIPGYAFNSADKSTGNIANLIRAIYKYAIGIVGILAAVVLMIGGVMWVVAGGSSTMIGEAKAWIGASLTGLVIALCSYLILATVNPALVDLKTTTIGTVTPINSTNSGCEGITNQGICTGSAGCTWNNNICSRNTNPDQAEKCGLAANEMTGPISCCRKPGTSQDKDEYKYARISFNRNCQEICGNDWAAYNIPNACKSNLGY